jgi:hypothetical protein
MILILEPAAIEKEERMTRWQDTHDPLCPSHRAKNWQIWWGPIWCQCHAIRLGRLEGEQDFRRAKAVILGDLRANVQALRDEAQCAQHDNEATNSGYAAAQDQGAAFAYTRVLALIDERRE